MFDDLLLPMFDDEYYPDILVAEVKQLILRFGKQIASGALTEDEVYHVAHNVIDQINEMKPQFDDLESSLDDTAADYIAEAMMMLAQEYGYLDLEIENLIANREW